MIVPLRMGKLSHRGALPCAQELTAKAGQRGAYTHIPSQVCLKTDGVVVMVPAFPLHSQCNPHSELSS